MNINLVEILSERVRMVPISPQYTQIIFDSLNNRVTRYMLITTPKDISETEAFVSTSMHSNEKGTNLQLVALERGSGSFLGCIGIHHIDREAPVLGLWFAESAHGKGYGIEAMGALIEWARENLQFDYLRYEVDKDNERSRRIPVKYGGVLQGEPKDEEARGGKTLHIVEYHIYK